VGVESGACHQGVFVLLGAMVRAFRSAVRSVYVAVASVLLCAIGFDRFRLFE